MLRRSGRPWMSSGRLTSWCTDCCWNYNVKDLILKLHKYDIFQSCDEISFSLWNFVANVYSQCSSYFIGYVQKSREIQNWARNSSLSLSFRSANLSFTQNASGFALCTRRVLFLKKKRKKTVCFIPHQMNNRECCSLCWNYLRLVPCGCFFARLKSFHGRYTSIYRECWDTHGAIMPTFLKEQKWRRVFRGTTSEGPRGSRHDDEVSNAFRVHLVTIARRDDCAWTARRKGLATTTRKGIRLSRHRTTG